MSGPDTSPDAEQAAAVAEMAARQLVVDSALIAFAALALALPVYAMLRSAGVPTLKLGRVQVDRLGLPDLAVACAIVALLVSMIAGQTTPPTGQDQPATPDNPGLLETTDEPPRPAIAGPNLLATAPGPATNAGAAAQATPNAGPPPGGDTTPDPDAGDSAAASAADPGATETVRTPSSIGIWFSAMFWGTVSLAVILYLGRIRGLPVISWMGLSNFHPGRTVGVALLALLVTLPIVFAAAAAFNRLVLEPSWPDLGAQEAVKLFMTSSDLSLRVALIVSAVIVAPLAEELLFRGFLYPAIKRFTDPVFAMLCSGLLFAAVHNNLPALIPLFILGIAFAAVYEYSGSLWTPIWMHAMFNFSSILLMLLGGGELAPGPLPDDMASATGGNPPPAAASLPGNGPAATP